MTVPRNPGVVSLLQSYQATVETLILVYTLPLRIRNTLIKKSYIFVFEEALLLLIFREYVISKYQISVLNPNAGMAGYGDSRGVFPVTDLIALQPCTQPCSFIHAFNFLRIPL